MAKAFELRLKEATDLVTAYSLGDLTPEQADERSWRYQHRWGEALSGASVSDGVTDEQILSKIDQTRGKYFSVRESGEKYKALFGKTPGPSSASR
jgi:hypothetical protein